ncbi:hypothetical protein H2200_009262 [Cladophialophora chaetospira]|uniref:Cytochrome P450 n=1 Tax=Cladophialophora chaetospira TaxID=386627 RepID=A0AA38X3Z4_9EURO|nr:hypothetical protein H2200_009262 [Cladophialophora chaetospira]
MNLITVDTSSADVIMPKRLYVLVIVLAASLCLRLLYKNFKDPLRSIPGPLLGRLTGLWITLIEFSGNRSTTVHELHKKYGPVVRLAPNQLSFATTQALKDIYGANSNYTKAPIYETLGFKSTFTTRDRDEYRGMKKRIIPSFSPASIREMEPLVHRQLANLIKCFDKRVDAPLDILPWFRMLALGVVGEGFAGESFCGLETEKMPQLLHDIDWVFPALITKWSFPITSRIFEYLPFKAARQFLNAAEDFKKYCGSAYFKYLNSFDTTARHDLIARMVNERTELLKKGQSIPRHVTETGIIEELTNLIFAGTDTTGNTLTYLFWELAHHPEWQLRLRAELKESISEQTNPDYAAVSELPVLEGITQEIFRLRPASPNGLPRVTSASGGVIDGIVVPPQTIVSCQALTLHRDPILFHEPDRFNPQRWIDASKTEVLEQMREQMFLFGKGARSCLGRTLATMEIKLTLVAIVQRYHVEIGSATTDKDMEMIDHFVLIPKGQKCVLKLTRV